MSIVRLIAFEEEKERKGFNRCLHVMNKRESLIFFECHYLIKDSMSRKVLRYVTRMFYSLCKFSSILFLLLLRLNSTCTFSLHFRSVGRDHEISKVYVYMIHFFFFFFSSTLLHRLSFCKQTSIKSLIK